MVDISFSGGKYSGSQFENDEFSTHYKNGDEEISTSQNRSVEELDQLDFA